MFTPSRSRIYQIPLNGGFPVTVREVQAQYFTKEEREIVTDTCFSPVTKKISTHQVRGFLFQLCRKILTVFGVRIQCKS